MADFQDFEISGERHVPRRDIFAASQKLMAKAAEWFDGKAVQRFAVSPTLSHDDIYGDKGNVVVTYRASGWLNEPKTSDTIKVEL